jgi:carbamoyl-phosphate synthase small subunit
VIKELSPVRSNWRADMDLGAYLKKNNIIGIQGIDTRALTRHIRLQGAMQAVISSEDFDAASLLKKVKASVHLTGVDLVKEVTCSQAYDWQGPAKKARYKVAVLDCGVKYNILRHLALSGCRAKVFPAKTGAEELLKFKPDGLLLSNGPGDPAAVGYVVQALRCVLGKLPVFGICLGHQMLGLALGAKTYKLKFGHHGANHPVKDLKTGKVAITSQNHGFCVDFKSIKCKGTELTHINLYDNTVEGLENRRLKLFSVQYHPEAGPGPHDANYLFKEFTRLMDKNA